MNEELTKTQMVGLVVGLFVGVWVLTGWMDSCGKQADQARTRREVAQAAARKPVKAAPAPEPQAEPLPEVDPAKMATFEAELVEDGMRVMDTVYIDDTRTLRVLIDDSGKQLNWDHLAEGICRSAQNDDLMGFHIRIIRASDPDAWLITHGADCSRKWTPAQMSPGKPQ